jgi:hypothetical protein
MLKAIAWVVLIPFSVLSAGALWQVGYLPLFTQQFQNLGTLQVLVDLVIACSLLMMWVWRDARHKGRNPWPYFFITLAAGSFGPLLYFALAPRSRALPLQSAVV